MGNVIEVPTLRRLAFLSDTESLVNAADEPRNFEINRAAALAVISNPFGGQFNNHIAQVLADFSETVGALVTPQLVTLLDTPAARYGKGAIAGTHGRLEHLAALLHPKLGKPMRSSIGGGLAVIPSTQKVGSPGCMLDVPIGDKDDPWSFAAIDTFTVGLADAPAADEFLLVVVLAGPPAEASTG
ncbi:MAG: amino acid synthesis family protein [Aquisalimonadaceae bacterium]